MDDKNYVLFRKAKSLIENNQPKEAMVLLEKLREFEPNDYSVEFELAKLYLKSNNKEKDGEKILLNQIKCNINLAYAALELGKYYSKHLDFVKAMQCFDKVLSIKPKNVNDKKEIEKIRRNRCYVNLEIGRLYVNVCNIKKAREYFKKLIDSNAENKNFAILEMGKLEVIEENYDVAREFFKSLLNNKTKDNKNNTNDNKKNSKDKYYGMLELARLEIKLKNFELAENYLNELIEDNPCNKEYALLEQGKLCVIQGDLDRAEHIFTGLLNTRIRNNAELELGKLEFLRGNIENAKIKFKGLLNGSDEDRMYANLELGIVYVFEDELEEAEKSFKSLLNTKNWYYARFELGLLYSLIGDIDKANEQFKILIDRNSPNKELAKEELERVKTYKKLPNKN